MIAYSVHSVHSVRSVVVILKGETRDHSVKFIVCHQYDSADDLNAHDTHCGDSSTDFMGESRSL